MLARRPRRAKFPPIFPFAPVLGTPEKARVM